MNDTVAATRLPKSDSKEIQKIIDLLNQGKNKTIFKDDIVLLLGITGSGKSTAVQWLTGSNPKLRSVEEGEDTGEYLIIDDDKISNNTILSKTIFPELIVDRETGINYYDCPGFSDTRSASHDITATYLIKQLIDHAKNVKIILVINYPSVQKGVDRRGFVELITHTTNMIKNIEIYSNSIALLVTKVNNDYSRGKLVSDNKVINKISSFLRNVKTSLENITENKNDTFYTQIMILIDTFLEKQENSYKNIAIFRRPDNEGPLNEIDNLKEGKNKTREMVKNLRFTTINKSDFGYTLSDKSKTVISDLNEQLNQNIMQVLKEILEEIALTYNTLISNNTNLRKLQTTLQNQINRVWEIINKSGAEQNINKQFLYLLDVLDILELKLNLEKLNKINNLISYINFLQELNNKKLKSQPSEWKQILIEIKNITSDWKEWLDFLYEILEHLASYQVQSGKVKVPNEINMSNIHVFLKAIKNVNNKEYVLTSVSNQKLDMLNSLLTFALKGKWTYEYVSPQKLIVKGDFIKFSEVLKIKTKEKVRQYEIYVSDSFYMDADLNAVGDKINLIIFASKIIVVGSRYINLNGRTGNEITQSASNGQFSGAGGADGKPGYPGGNGGNILAICSKIINSEHLQISANGGSGGNGQKGGNGMDGSSGNIPQVPSGKFYGVCDSTDEFQEIDKHLLYAVVYGNVVRKYEAFGSSGENGGAGGDGGAGGIGGLGGEVQFFSLQSKIYTKIENKGGSLGKPGVGGSGGQGGWQYQVLATCTNHVVGVIFWREWSKTAEYHHTQSISGRTGRSGANTNGRQLPEALQSISKKDESISKFKKYLITKTGNSLLKEETLTLLINLNTNTEVTAILKEPDFNYSNEQNTNYLSFYENLRHETLNVLNNSKNLRKKRRTLINTVSSTAVAPTSPINTLIYWIKESLQPLQHLVSFSSSMYSYISNPFYEISKTTTLPHQFDAMNFKRDNLTENAMSSSNTFQSQHSQYSASNYNFNETFLLTDVLIRKITGEKYNCLSYSVESHLDIQALAINIVTKFENYLVNDQYGSHLNFDPVETQKKVFESISQYNNCNQISNILLNSIKH